jgi:hypothetical protein
LATTRYKETEDGRIGSTVKFKPSFPPESGNPEVKDDGVKNRGSNDRIAKATNTGRLSLTRKITGVFVHSPPGFPIGTFGNDTVFSFIGQYRDI